MRVLVVDDSAFMRKVIREMIQTDDILEVIDTARDGVEAVEKAIKLKPDLITMDIEMPRKNGLDALREIMIQCKSDDPAVLMCSSLTVDGSVEALKALKIGAADFIAKDPQVVGKHDPDFQRNLLAKLRAIGSHRRRMRSPATNGSITASARSRSQSRSIPIDTEQNIPNGLWTSFDDWEMPSKIDVIVVGSSTGGPPVLEKIFSNLPATLPVPIIVAQHMPELFTKSLASRLDSHCSCGSMLADHGTTMTHPRIYIAQGGHHIKPTLVAGKKLVARSVDEFPGAIYKPSVDLLFSTAAKLFGSGVLAIQLTGMGEDGGDGARMIKAAGGQVIAQSERTCVVYGMPKAVVDNGSACAVMSPEDIQKVLLRICNSTQSGGENGVLEARKSA